jgi:hypothetical protein
MHPPNDKEVAVSDREKPTETRPQTPPETRPQTPADAEGKGLVTDVLGSALGTAGGAALYDAAKQKLASGKPGSQPQTPSTPPADNPPPPSDSDA